MDFLPAFGGFSALQQYLCFNKGRIVSFVLMRAAKFSCDGIVCLPQDIGTEVAFKEKLEVWGPMLELTT